MLDALDWIGRIVTIIFIIGLIWGFYNWSLGIFPALLRLGNGLAKRKIAIFAKSDNYNSLKSLLCDSGLFKEKNISQITSSHDLDQAEKASFFLVYWHDWDKEIDEILRIKLDKCPLVIYCPLNEDRIPQKEMEKLDGKRHTAVSNFRGRLLNDIVTAMITTVYEK